MERIFESFKLFDKNNDGVISNQELFEAIQLLATDPNSINESEINEIHQTVDQNNDGFIQFSEFLEIVAPFANKIEQPFKNTASLPNSSCSSLSEVDIDLKQVFEIYDRNNDGFISKEEVKTVMHGLGEELSNADIDLMMNYKEKLDFADFKSMICSNDKTKAKLTRQASKGNKNCFAGCTIS